MKEKVGYAYVVADIFHIGHLKHIQNCKKYCDKLIVGVLTDEATMEKKAKPIIPFDERFEIIKNIKDVDFVMIQKTYTPFNSIKKLKVDILFESTSHSKEAIEEAIKKSGKEVKVMPYYEDQSSTLIKEKIINDKRKSITRI